METAVLFTHEPELFVENVNVESGMPLDRDTFQETFEPNIAPVPLFVRLMYDNPATLKQELEVAFSLPLVSLK